MQVSTRIEAQNEPSHIARLIKSSQMNQSITDMQDDVSKELSDQQDPLPQTISPSAAKDTFE